MEFVELSFEFNRFGVDEDTVGVGIHDHFICLSKFTVDVNFFQ